MRLPWTKKRERTYEVTRGYGNLRVRRLPDGHVDMSQWINGNKLVGGITVTAEELKRTLDWLWEEEDA